MKQTTWFASFFLFVLPYHVFLPFSHSDISFLISLFSFYIFFFLNNLMPVSSLFFSLHFYIVEQYYLNLLEFIYSFIQTN